MTDGELLLAAILEHPEEDTPRLVYADWLEENGEGERAEFIRVQVKISKTRMTCEKTFRTLSHDRGHVLFTLRCRCSPCSLARRNYNLGKNHTVWDWCVGIPAVSVNFYRRGFVSEVRLPLAAWDQHAADIWSRHPVTRCVIVGAEPIEGLSGHWSWEAYHPRHYGPSALPHDLYNAVVEQNGTDHFPTPEAALDALSRAACLVGRRRALKRAQQAQEVTT